MGDRRGIGDRARSSVKSLAGLPSAELPKETPPVPEGRRPARTVSRDPAPAGRRLLDRGRARRGPVTGVRRSQTVTAFPTSPSPAPAPTVTKTVTARPTPDPDRVAPKVHAKPEHATRGQLTRTVVLTDHGSGLAQVKALHVKNSSWTYTDNPHGSPARIARGSSRRSTTTPGSATSSCAWSTRPATSWLPPSSSDSPRSA